MPASVRALDADAPAVELVATPFFAQRRYQCGPAALATVLVASGVDTDADTLTPLVYVPGLKGSLQAEILAAARGFARIPYPIDARLSAIVDELDAGRPVLVLQNLGIAPLPRWHFAVVVGIDPAIGSVYLRSGTVARRVTPIDVFLRTWRRSDYWGVVILDPTALPANVDRPRYFNAIAAMEQAGQASAAAAAWQTALMHWPEDPVAQFGLGNAQLAAADFALAVETYRALLSSAPELHAARNNLALALAGMGDFEDALRVLDVALRQSDDPALITEMQHTRADIAQRAKNH